MTPTEIGERVRRLDTRSAREEESAWNELRPMGEAVVPYLAQAYPEFRKAQGRVSLVFHAIRYARTSEDAFRLGVTALKDRATLVRYRACGLLAYSLRREALSHLEELLTHPDSTTAEDAKAAITAIKKRNHHLFIDRDHTGHITWEVNKGDSVHAGIRRPWYKLW